MKVSSSSSGGIGFVGLLTIVFIALKLKGVMISRLKLAAKGARLRWMQFIG